MVMMQVNFPITGAHNRVIDCCEAGLTKDLPGYFIQGQLCRVSKKEARQQACSSAMDFMLNQFCFSAQRIQTPACAMAIQET